MRLKSLHISQYKNLRDFSLSFDGSSFIDVFVGKNGTGKSNLFEALIEIFRHIVEYDRTKADLGFSYRLVYEIDDSETAIEWSWGEIVNTALRERPKERGLVINGRRRKTIGKTQFSPTSPNKTLEGVIGGIAFATVAGTIAGYFMELVPFFIAIIVSFLTATTSVFGDLFESYIKREAGVKDSGDIFPGHGGVLDRLDGYLFGAVMMLIALRAFL